MEPSPPESRGLAGRWDGRWRQAAQLCGSQGCVIDGPRTAASVSQAHAPICHLCLGEGLEDRDGTHLCTHHQVQEGLLPLGEPSPLLPTPHLSQSPILSETRTCGPPRLSPLAPASAPWRRRADPPLKGPFGWAALSTPLAVPTLGVPSP